MSKNDSVITGIKCDSIKRKTNSDKNNLNHKIGSNNTKVRDWSEMAVVGIHNTHNMPLNVTKATTNITSKNYISINSSLNCCDTSKVWRDYKKLKTYLLFKDRDKRNDKVNF